MGDASTGIELATWVGAVGQYAGPLLGIVGSDRLSQWRIKRALRFEDDVRDASGLDDVRLLELVESNERLQELIAGAVADVATSAWEAKRRALASVVAAALTDDVTLDEAEALRRTLQGVDEGHAKALAIIYVHNIENQSTDHLLQAAGPDNIRARWPGATGLLDPLLTVLDREALIRTGYTYNDQSPEQRQWRITGWGCRFLEYLDGTHRPEPIWPIDEDRPPSADKVTRLPELNDRAQLIVELVPHGKGKTLAVRNNGPAIAYDVWVELGSDAALGPIVRETPWPMTMRPSETINVPAITTGQMAPFVDLEIRWRDGGGEHAEERTLGTA